MSGTHPDWSEAAVAEAVRRFNDGQPASQIAAALNVSRNAVCGKLARLGITRRGGKAKPVSDAGRSTHPWRQRKSRKAATPARPPASKPKPKVPVPYDPDRRKATIFELGPCMCRWPFSVTPDPDDDLQLTYRFCAAPTGGSMPEYCDHHAKIASTGAPQYGQRKSSRNAYTP
jgi:GcrA cell cycle regulator